MADAMKLTDLIEEQADNFACGLQDHNFLRGDDGSEPLGREMIRLNLEQFAKRLAASPPAREEAPEHRECIDCGFKGTSEQANTEQDYCTACEENGPVGGSDKCSHCGVENHMVMACPVCSGRFALDEDDFKKASDRECGDAGREAIWKVVHEVWQMLDDSENDVSNGKVTVEHLSYQAVSDAMCALEELVPESVGPFWGGFPVNYFWGLK